MENQTDKKTEFTAFVKAQMKAFRNTPHSFLEFPPTEFNLEEKVIQTYIELFGGDGRMEFSNLLTWYHIFIDPNNRNLIGFYETPEKAAKNRPTIGKPAKILRKIIPLITEKQATAFAEWHKETYVLPYEGMEIKSGETPEIFAEIYTANQAPAANPRLGENRKSLTASCMRYEFDHLPQHPCSVYGSGDFRLYWIANGQGAIAARAIVCIKSGGFVPGPIYTNSDIAADMLEKHLDAEKEKAENKEKKTWLNARLLRVEYNGGFIGPYMDRDCGVCDQGDILVISRQRAEFEFSTTSGVSEGGYQFHCDICDDGLDEYDIYSSGDGYCYCEHCFNDRFAYCDHCQEYESRDSMVEFYMTADRTDCACDYCVNNSDWIVPLTESAEGISYANIDCTVVTECGAILHEYSENYFISELDGLCYHTNEAAKLPSWYTFELTVTQARDCGLWDELPSGEFVLRIYFERTGGALCDLPRMVQPSLPGIDGPHYEPELVAL